MFVFYGILRRADNTFNIAFFPKFKRYQIRKAPQNSPDFAELFILTLCEAGTSETLAIAIGMECNSTLSTIEHFRAVGDFQQAFF